MPEDFQSITLSRQVDECVTIFTSDGPVEVEFAYFKGTNAVALRFLTPPGMLVLRNELLDDQGNPCHQTGKSTFGKSTSTRSMPESTSPPARPAQSSTKPAVACSPPANSNAVPLVMKTGGTKA